MKKLTVKKDVITLINGLKEQADTIVDMERVPQPEIMLMLHKIQELHKKIIVFEHLNAQTETHDTPDVEVIMPLLDPIVKTENETVAPEVIKKTIIQPLEMPEQKTTSIDIHLMKQETAVNKADKKNAIVNLNAVIGINDRFQFANELFGGNMQEYNIAIQQLSASETVESAIQYFKNLQQLYKWEEENKTAKRLFAFLSKNTL